MLNLDDLNREQLEAVLTTKGPLLVLAGAGSGKTRVITYRLAHLISEGVDPKQILSVTFTNKAAREMHERAHALVGKAARGTTISTFHALGVRILRTYPEQAGLKPGFNISDGSEQLGTVRRVLRTLRIDDKKFDAKLILETISLAKNAGIDAATFRKNDGCFSDHELPDDDYRLAAIEVYEKYESGLIAQNVVDFDDLLLLTDRLLAKKRKVLSALRKRWRFLMIDEYQDTNHVQFELMRRLAGKEKNLCVVGDDDQSIYGWRGADVSNILRFAKHFPGAKTVTLEMNYRSTGNILAVANSIIEKNPERHPKTLRAAAGEGAPVRIVAVEDEEQEAEEVARSVLSLMAGGVKAKDVAVLVRSAMQVRPLEMALRLSRIPYRVVGGMELFDRKEVRDTIAYLKVLQNPHDEQSLRRIINYPPRGIGDTTIGHIDQWTKDRDLPFSAGLAQVFEIPDVSPKGASAIAELSQLLSKHRKLMKSRKISTVVRSLLEAIKLEDALFSSNDNATTASRKVDNVRDIANEIDRFEARVQRERRRSASEARSERGKDEEEDDLAPELESKATLDAFLRDLALVGPDDAHEAEGQKNEAVISTIHGAKGLEWPFVFLVGAEEELLPHAKTVEEGSVSEERRLAYVAVTRARSELTISYAMSRTRWGKILERMRSRFLDGLPEEAIEICEGKMKKERTEEEQDAIAQHWMATIRANLGMEEG